MDGVSIGSSVIVAIAASQAMKQGHAVVHLLVFRTARARHNFLVLADFRRHFRHLLGFQLRIFGFFQIFV